MRERAKSGSRTKKREGGRVKERKRRKSGDYSQLIVKNSTRPAVGGLSILIGQFWLFRQQVSRHDGI